MPKAKQSKKATPKQRQALYPTPPRPTPGSHSSTAAPSIPGARIFPPPPASRWPRPDSAYFEDALTPYEQGQSFLEFIRERQNGTGQSPHVVEDESVGDDQVRDDRQDEKPFEPGTQNGDDTQPNTENSSGQSSPPDPCPPPGLSPNSPEESTPEYPPTPEPLTEAGIWLERFKPLIEFNQATPWPVPFHEQPVPTPAWHAECPEGYEPTILAGYPIRRQYDLWIPAAHDPDLVRDEYGHYCLNLDKWDHCCMGKCEGCEIGRPGL